MNNINDVQAALIALRESYLSQLSHKVSEINSLWTTLSAGEAEEGLARTLLRHIHSLAGSGASFGFVAVSERAHELELFFSPFVKLERSLDGAETGEFLRLLSALDACVREILAREASANEVNTPTKNDLARKTHHEGLLTIFLVDDDHLFALNVASQLEQYGYHVRIFQAPEELLLAVQENPPAAILMDMELPGTNGAAIIASLNRDVHAAIPVVFISGHSDLDSRLAAVRASGDAYLTKPLNMVLLVDKLDRLTQRVVNEPYHMLVVGDNPVVMNDVATVLRTAGMSVITLDRPENTMSCIAQHAPELLLMNVSMGFCSGIEMARVIRQSDQYVDLPIVFIASPDEEHLEQEGIRSGADDFLIMPVADGHLYSTLRSRADRYRMMRRVLEQDGLTGLFNRSRLTASLIQELNRAKRYGGEFCFALLDVDHFKYVNDTYGHPVGDSVLQSLARILKQRVRKTDIVGRYGGEEFGIVFLNTNIRDARSMLDQIREEFSNLVHVIPEGMFQVTFSAGIADFPAFLEVKELYDEADKSLYKAKQSGRNLIVLAGKE